MQGELILLAVLVVVFLGEGLCLVPRGTWFFRRSLSGVWRAYPAHMLPMLRGFHLCFGGILPWQLAIRTQAPPFLPNPEGVIGIHPGLPGPPSSQAEPVALHPWPALRDLRREETQLQLGTYVLAQAADEGTARHWRKFLKNLANLPAEERHSMARRSREDAWDTRDAARRWRRFKRLSPSLFVLAGTQFLLVFLLFPLLLLSGWILVFWLPLLVLLLLNQSCLIILFRRIRARIHPDGGKGSRSLAFSMFLSPPYLIRAPEMLSMDLFEGLHPLCAAWVLLKRDAFLEQAEAFLRALQHPFPLEDPVLQALLQEGITSQRKDLVQWLEARGIQSGALMQVPTADGFFAYCPRCRSQFLRTEGDCSACPGIALEPADLRR